MSDWAVGDRAVCISTKSLCGICGEDDEIAEGQVVTVCAVFPYWGRTGLDFVETSPGSPWCPCAFRKVVSDKHEACETEFVTLLKRSKVPALLEDEGSCQEVTKQIREWREEDRRAGVIWSDEQ